MRFHTEVIWLKDYLQIRLKGNRSYNKDKLCVTINYKYKFFNRRSCSNLFKKGRPC